MTELNKMHHVFVGDATQDDHGFAWRLVEVADDLVWFEVHATIYDGEELWYLDDDGDLDGAPHTPEVAGSVKASGTMDWALHTAHVHFGSAASLLAFTRALADVHQAALGVLQAACRAPATAN